MYYSMVFFTNVLRHLQERGLTQKWLAEEAHVSNSFITDVMRGRNLSLKKMEAIAEALKIPLPLLLQNNDMNEAAQRELAGVNATAPEGYEYVTALLPAHRAFEVRKWDEEARSKIKMRKT